MLTFVVFSVGRIAVGSDETVGIIILGAVTVGSIVADVPGVVTDAAFADVGVEINVAKVGNGNFVTDACAIAAVSVKVESVQAAAVGGFA